MSKRRFIFILLSLSLLFTTVFSLDQSDDDDDLALLDSDETAASPPHDPPPSSSDDEEDDDYYDDSYDDTDFDAPGGEEEYTDDLAVIDDKDVVVLTERNLSDFVENNRYVMVEFYAPWCGHCKELAPEYAAAAAELKEGDDVAVLAKVDATKDRELAQEYDVKGFPTMFFFVDGEHLPYTGHRTKDAIVTWIRKKTGPGVYNITTTEEAERVLTPLNKVVLAFLESLESSASEEFAAASKLNDDLNFYQTVNPDVAKLFHMDPDAKHPTLVMLKKEEEKVNLFDGQFIKSAIAEFVSANKLPLVTTFTKENAATVFESPIRKQVLLFAAKKDSKKLIPTFQEAAKSFKGKLIFIHIETDDEEVGKPIAEYFSITGKSPQVIGYLSDENAKKFIFKGVVTLDEIKEFGENFVQNKLKPFHKSDPLPETNDGDVKIVVGNNIDEIVLDESKDVLLEVYAPWCGQCQSLEPTYNKLAQHLRGIESLVIAKMDGTTNEHPSATANGFPTLLFFPAGKNNSIKVDSDHTVVELYKFLKKHASIPFKLQKSATTSDSEGDGVEKSLESSSAELNDEL